MITTVVGRTFLQAYNNKYQCDKSPQEFFEEIYFELFYNHPKYMQWVTNSSFVQGLTSSDCGIAGREIGKVNLNDTSKIDALRIELEKNFGKDRVLIKTKKDKGKLSFIEINDERQRIERLEKFHEKVLREKPDGSFVLGYPASDTDGFAVTSGLVTNIEIPTSIDDIYLSWIGSGLSIGIAGGYSILIDNPEITLKTFDGWKVYRRYLNERNAYNLPGNKINTWNGQWLTYSLNIEEFDDNFDFATLINQGFFKLIDKQVDICTVNWSRLFFSFSASYPGKEFIGYVHSLGDINNTIGFIPFSLKSGKKIIEVYQKLFGDTSTDKRKFESLFGMHIKRACELGSIGLQALRPEGITKYMQDERNLSFKKEDELINYYAYKTWLIAMLTKNKEEITEYTFKLAEVILRYRNGSKGMERPTLINKELFASKGKKGFLEALVVMIQGLDGEDLEMINQLKNDIHLMTNEEFGYFTTLLKFDYAYQEKKS